MVMSPTLGCLSLKKTRGLHLRHCKTLVCGQIKHNRLKDGVKMKLKGMLGQTLSQPHPNISLKLSKK